MNIFIGNISRDATEDDLRRVFEPFGQVKSVSMIKDKLSRESKGFGFVEMPVIDEAQFAIRELNGKDLKGRKLTVNEARPRPASESGHRPGGNRPGGGRRF